MIVVLLLMMEWLYEMSMSMSMWESSVMSRSACWYVESRVIQQAT